MHCNIFVSSQELHSIFKTISEVKKYYNILAILLWFLAVTIWKLYTSLNPLAEDKPPRSK